MTWEELAFQCKPLNYTDLDFKDSLKKRISTQAVIKDLMKLGWDPVEFFIGGGDNRDIKHAIVFNISLPPLRLENTFEDIVPQVLLISDNGLTPFRFYITFYNRAYDSRIFIPIKHEKSLTIKNFYISFRSRDYNLQNLVDNIIVILVGVLENSQKLLDYVSRTPTTREVSEFTYKAFLRRKNQKVRSDRRGPHKSIVKTLEPIVKDQEFKNMWSLLNSIQSKMLRGFETYPSIQSKRLFKYKEITSLERIIKFSVELYLDIFKIVNK